MNIGTALEPVFEPVVEAVVTTQENIVDTMIGNWQRITGPKVISNTANTNSEPAAARSLAVKGDMNAKVAARVVRRWQTIKAEALGGLHKSDTLDQILDGEMLEQWQQRAKDVQNAGELSWSNINVSARYETTCVSLTASVGVGVVAQDGIGNIT